MKYRVDAVIYMAGDSPKNLHRPITDESMKSSHKKS